MRQEVHSLHNNTNRKVYFKYHSPSLLPVKHFASLNVPTCLNMLYLTCRYIRDNQQYAFRLHCLFFYHDLTVSLLFLNCLTLIIKVLLTYHFTAHGTEKLVTLSAKDMSVRAQLLTHRCDNKLLVQATCLKQIPVIRIWHNDISIYPCPLFQ